LDKYFNIIIVVIISCFVIFFSFACDLGTRSAPSPSPGVLRVTLQADFEDTFIIVGNDTLVVSLEDRFELTVYQGKIYNGDNYAFLFEDTTSYSIEDLTYNIFEIDSLENKYKKFTIYESYLSPRDYDRIQFGITPGILEIGDFTIPVKVPNGTNPIFDFFHEIQILENTITEINIQISPFKSVFRYRDLYHFIPLAEIISVNYF